MADNYKQYKKAKKERNFYGQGQAVSGSIAGLGAATLGARKYLKSQAKKAVQPTSEDLNRINSAGKVARNVRVTPEQLKQMKTLGGIALGVGGVGLAYTTVKRQRAERKLKELSKDDNKKKD